MFLFKWIRAIKIWEHIENKKIVWYTISDQNTLKSVLTNFSIVVLSYSKIDKKPLWNIYEVWVSDKNKENKAVIIFAVNWKIKEAFKYFVDTYWITQIDYIKPYWTEVDEQKLKLILNKLNSEFWINASKKSDFGNTKGWERTLKNIRWEEIIDLDQKIKEEILDNVNEFIQEMEEFIPTAKPIVPVESSELEKLVLELKKYRKTTNMYKIAEVYKRALELAEKLYDKYYLYLKKEEEKQWRKEIISQIDIVAEYEKYKKVKRAKTLEKVNAKEFWFPWYEVIYYKIFWKYWVDIKLLFAELVKKYKLNYFWFNEILKFIQFILIFLLIDYFLLLIYKKIVEWLQDVEILSIYYMFFVIGFLWLIITVWKIVCKYNRFIWIVLIILWLFLLKYLHYFFAI